jgi:hypothetical protein
VPRPAAGMTALVMWYAMGSGYPDGVPRIGP